MVTLHRSPRSNLIVRTCFSFQGLRSTTTSRRGPRLGSWPLPAAAPVVSGNRWCWSFIRPSRRFFVHFWTTRKTALIFNHRIKSKDGKKISSTRLWLVTKRRWSEILICVLIGATALIEGLSLDLNCSAKIELIILTLIKSAHYHPACIVNCEMSKPVQFLMVRTEVMSTELFKTVSITPPSLSHTQTYTVDTIAVDSCEDVCGSCLWLHRPLGVPLHRGFLKQCFCFWWTAPCGDEIQLLQTPCTRKDTLSEHPRALTASDSVTCPRNIPTSPAVIEELSLWA